jgi:hypothetical protein
VRPSVTVTVNGAPLAPQWPGGSVTTVTQHLCPDLLRLEQIGAADGLRGRVVRAFFVILHTFDRAFGLPWWSRS